MYWKVKYEITSFSIKNYQFCMFILKEKKKTLKIDLYKLFPWALHAQNIGCFIYISENVFHFLISNIFILSYAHCIFISHTGVTHVFILAYTKSCRNIWCIFMNREVGFRGWESEIALLLFSLYSQKSSGIHDQVHSWNANYKYTYFQKYVVWI